MDAFSITPHAAVAYLVVSLIAVAATIAIAARRPLIVDVEALERLGPELLAGMFRSPRAAVVTALISLVARQTLEVVEGRVRVSAGGDYRAPHGGRTELERLMLERVEAGEDDIASLVHDLEPEAARRVSAIDAASCVQLPRGRWLRVASPLVLAASVGALVLVYAALDGAVPRDGIEPTIVVGGVAGLQALIASRLSMPRSPGSALVAARGLVTQRHLAILAAARATPSRLDARGAALAYALGCVVVIDELRVPIRTVLGVSTR